MGNTPPPPSSGSSPASTSGFSSASTSASTAATEGPDRIRGRGDGPEAPDGRGRAVRSRLEEALATAVADKGLAATTIADVARLAGTSKRTFYEHYTDKTECYLSLYAARSAAMVAEIDEALRPGELPATVQLAAAARTFLDVVSRDPVLGRGHLSELATLGEQAARVRREVVDRQATSILGMVERARANGTAVRRISHLEAVCVVGGLNEIGLRAVDAGSGLSRDDLVETATRFMTAVLLAD